MSGTKWTPEQTDAIEARGGTLLVSAAAGSGKTAVLSERVLRMLTDPQHPTDADRLLIVTFTKAAAAEMKQRITDKLAACLEENPGNRYLQRQQMLLERAHISTVHGFCMDLLRAHFHQLGISPTFRIASDDEILLLSGRVIDALSEEIYHRMRTAPTDGLRELIELFSDDRDDRRLGETIRRLYEYVRSHPFPEQWLRQRTEQYRNFRSLAETEWATVLFDYAKDTATQGVMLAESAISTAQMDESTAKAYIPALTGDLASLVQIHEAAEKKDWDGLVYAVQRRTSGRLGSAREANEQIKEQVKSLRNDVKKLIEGLSKLFDQPEEEARRELAGQYEVIRAISELVTEYGHRLDALKKEKNLLDFGDLEHGALKLLVTEAEDGVCHRTPLALKLQEDFDELMIDEYQDTNGVQELIFKAVSKNEENLFMVGDVKQSIYRFRQASPELFIQRRDQYPLYDRTNPSFPATILLGKNFRSRSGVTGICNFLFRQLMSRELGEVDYTPEEELVPQAEYPETKELCATFALLNGQADMNELREAWWISDEIRDMVDREVPVQEKGVSRPAQYRDFCILLRSAVGHVEEYIQALQLNGIPCVGNVSGGFFQQKEVSFLLSLLRVIDNPVQDIPLLAVLCAPVYGFTVDELAEIRLADKHRPLYHALKKTVEQGNVRVKEFLTELARWRRVAAAGSTRTLIEHIREEKQLDAVVLAMPNGNLRLANLRLLVEYAVNYEQAGYRGLPGFIRYIDRLQEQKGDLTPAAALPENANVVQIMTIHHSKGLEFPFVFLTDCGRSFNRQSLYGDLLLHPKLGAALRMRDPVTGVRYHTVAYDAVQAELARDEMSEQMRVLYVALTRAREQVFFVGSLKNPESTVARLATQLHGKEPVSPIAVRNANSFAEWLILGLLRHPDAIELRDMAENVTVDVLEEETESFIFKTTDINLAEVEDPAPPGMPPPNPILQQELQKRFEMKNPHEALSRIPVKAAISVLAEEEQAHTFALTARPAFLSKSGLSPAERGTAMHTYLQFADYPAAAADPVGELERLRTKGFLTEEQAAVIEPEKIRALFESPLGQRILHAGQVHREVRFLLDYPAKQWDPAANETDESVVLQGVADCVIEEDDGLVLIDFKTDRVQTAQTLVDRYTQQLRLYAEALNRCFEKPVKEKRLYSVHLNTDIPVE